MGIFNRVTKGTETEVSYNDYVAGTKQAIERYEKGKASVNDLAQIKHAAQQGARTVENSVYSGYKVTKQQHLDLMLKAEGIVEDDNNYTSDDEACYCQSRGICFMCEARAKG